MSKIIVILSAAVILLTGCDGMNNNIDDLPRTLRISARTINDTDDLWDQTEDTYKVVSTGVGNNIASGTVGTVTVTAGVKDDFVRSDEVTVTASAVDLSMIFAFWMLPSRTDEDRDPLSTEGNIRYSDGSSDVISLRTDYDESEIIGAFVKNGGSGNSFADINESINFTNTLTGTSSVDFAISLENSTGTDIIIRDPKYRIFDKTGEAVTNWEDYVQEGEITIIGGAGTSLDLTITLNGIEDRSEVDSWTVAIIYEDPADDSVYIVK